MPAIQSMATCEQTAAVRPLPPWRRRQSSAVEASTTPGTATNLQVQRKPWSKHPKSDDDISTTTGCSDIEQEETASQLSRSSSEHELGVVVSRDLMLLHRSRCVRASTPTEPSCGLHCRALVESPPVVKSPPGLTAKPVPSVPTGFVPPPGLQLLNGAALAIPPYSPPGFRKAFMAILKDLAIDRNVARAVRRVRAQGVPVERQAAEFADAMTFILEEPRGAARRSFVALLAGLAYGVFEKKQCAAGLDIFFVDVYPDLQAEVLKLNKLIVIEVLPTLGSVFSADELQPYAEFVKLGSSA